MQDASALSGSGVVHFLQQQTTAAGESTDTVHWAALFAEEQLPIAVALQALLWNAIYSSSQSSSRIESITPVPLQ